MKVQDHSKIQPTFTGPNVADVASPLLVWLTCSEVPIQQVRRNVELVVAIRCDLVFAGSHDRHTVLTLQMTDTTMADIQASLLQLFCHARPTIAAETKSRLPLIWANATRSARCLRLVERLRNALKARGLISMT